MLMKKNDFKNLTYNQRLLLNDLLKSQTNKQEIANILNCCLATVYREIKRGSINGIYNPTFAQKIYEKQLKNRGCEAKFSIDTQLAETVSKYILIDHLSPEMIISRLKANGISSPTKNTIYSAIDKGLIPNVTREDLRSKNTSMFSHGLIQIPVWIRKELNLQDQDLFTISLSKNRIILEKIKEQ